MTLHLSNKQARHLVLDLQGMTIEPHLRLDDAALMDLIHRLGFVQLDSIQWVERAHHMILYARNQTYRPKQLARLTERDRHLFEHWTHDSSFVPTAFYPYWRHRFERKRDNLARKFEDWQGDGYRRHCDDLKQRIEATGPIMSRDLEREDTGPRDMWQWHDGKAALEFLWHTGELCVAERRGFQKVYDIPEKVVAGDHFEKRVSEAEFMDWACRSAITRLGIGSPGDIARYWDLVSPAEAKVWAEEQLETGGVIPVTVEAVKGEGDRTLLARPDVAQVVDAVSPVPKRMRALSPFDPVIRDRKRLKWLFGFDYRIEIYVPEAKRKWGYYVFPLLEGDRLIGRIDMRANRKENRLEVRRLWLEDKIRLSAARLSRLQSELQRQARHTGMGKIVWLENSMSGIDGEVAEQIETGV